MSKKKIVKQIIESRRSIYPKDYSDKSISEKVLQRIIDSADFAPNHKRTKPWRFELFQNERKSELAMAMAAACASTSDAVSSEKKVQSIHEKFHQSDCVITISVNYSGKVPQWEELAATAMAVQNMYLTCTANKVGCYWGTPKEAEFLKDFLKLEENQMCLGLFYMGKLQEKEKEKNSKD